MVVKKFYGTTTREALRQVRDELGPDALILSNRQVAGGGVEIMAVADADVAALTSIQTVSATPSPSRRATQNGARLVESAQDSAPAARALARSYAIPDEDHDPTIDDLPTEAPLVLRSNRSNGARPTNIPPVAERPAMPPRSAPPPLRPKPMPTLSMVDDEAALAASAPQQDSVQDIAREVRLLRGLLESQLAGMAWNELSRQAPEKLEILRQLLASGFSPALSRQLIEKMPDKTDIETGLNWAQAALVHNMPILADGMDLISRGGVYALLGPTGVGKTTTVAKLAARCALAHGPQSVALLTTDSYRIGAHDQLRIYGRILGVPVHDVKDETDLQLTLEDLGPRHLILVDTVGMGQRDQRIAEQLRFFNQDNVGTLLLLAANAQASTLDDVARRYRNQRLVGCILTKLDESMALGGCLDVMIRHRLPLHFVTNGQRVPEDLHRGNARYLIDRSFRFPQHQGAFRLEQDEYPAYMGAQELPSDFRLKTGGSR